jgi:Tol biopolymer transport system component
VAILLVGACSTPPATTLPGATTASTSEASAPLTTPAGSSESPSASPGPSLAAGPGRIVFARFKPAHNLYELYTVNPDGSDLRELLPNWTYTLTLPRWSWQGDLVLARAPSTATILPTAAASHIHLLPDTTLHLICAAWSPDEQGVACEGWSRSKAGQEGLYTMASGIAALSPFTDERVPVPAPTRLTTAPKGVHDVPGDYSTDGRIAFVRTTYSVLGLGEIWVAKVDGSDAQKLTDTLSTYRIAWSHDGRWIVGERDGVLELFDLTDLTKDPARIRIPGGAASEPRFSPDGTRIVFVYTKSGAGTTSIESVALDGSGTVQITSGEVDRSPDWGTPGF